MAPKKYFAVKNQQASLLRRRKYELVRHFGLPEDALGGYLSSTLRRCGKPTCHCADGPGHPRWSLDYSFLGKKRVEIVPESLALELAPFVDEGRQLREAVMELLAINLQLLHLWRIEQRSRAKAPPTLRRAKPARQTQPRRGRKTSRKT